MTANDVRTTDIGRLVTTGDIQLWVDQRGTGPDVLLVAGLSDPAEAWELQLAALSDRYRVTAFDNRGAGRSPMVPEGFSVSDFADDAAGILRALDIPAAHVVGFSGGSLIAQELALRHPDLVQSLVLVSTWARPDAYFRTMTSYWRWLVDHAPSDREMLEAFLLWIYTPRAHESGWVDQVIEDTLAFPHQQSAEAFKRQLDPFRTHETIERLRTITAPTLVVAGEVDIASRPRLGKVVADEIPNAKFIILPGEAHQPFQESPDEFNALVDTFWQEVDATAG
ncbi:MAG: alpha/beta fold hydrolase [Acidimicrobiia bacterium]